MANYKELSIETKLIHDVKSKTRYRSLVNPPVARTSTILFETYEDLVNAEKNGYGAKSYGRSGTETYYHLARLVANLDGADNSIITPSGMSAIVFAIIPFIKPGDKILIPDNCYVATRNFAETELLRLGVKAVFYDPLITQDIEKLITKETRILFLESPGSGTFELQDIRALTKIAKKHKLITIFDNSWATAINFQPFQHGVDIIVQSLTKYINGHSDIILGSISAKDSKLVDIVQTTVRHLGIIPSPDDCYLALRGIRTLTTRMKQLEQNALEVSNWLANHDKIDKVLYPAHPTHPQYKLWKRDFKGASSTFSILVKQSKEVVYNFVNSLELFGIGLSWGGYESLVLPVNIKQYRTATNWSYKGFCIRMHIGLENPRDLIINLDKNIRKHFK